MVQKIAIQECPEQEYAQILEGLIPKLDDPVSFLQAPFYGHWQQANGKTVIFFRILDDETIIGAGLAIKYDVPLGKMSFLYCPYGPVVDHWTPAVTRALKRFFAPICKRLGAAFVRLDNDKLAQLPGIKTVPDTMAAMASLQPRAEWLLDIRPSLDDLLAGQHKKARYFVKLAERPEYNVRVKLAVPDEARLDAFYDLLQATAARDHFGIMSRDYYAAVFTALNKDTSFLALSYVDDTLAAAALCAIFDDQAHYVFGCSSDEYRKLAPAYHLQWCAIKEAKARCCSLYNFGGISDSVKSTHLEGVTRFKKRFGGYQVNHSNPVDIVYKPLQYKLFKSYKSLPRR